MSDSATITPTLGRSRLANAIKSGAPACVVTDARRDLAAANIEAYITKVVATAPPLSDAQRDHLAGLLNGGAR